MAHSPAYVSFLIRLWRESPSPVPQEADGWQGEVEHIQTGQRWTFDTPDELLRFLRRQVMSLETGWPAGK